MDRTGDTGYKPGANSNPQADTEFDLAALGTELIRQAKESQPEIDAAWDYFMKKTGIPEVEPVGIQRLREMLAKDLGSKPEDNVFSREIIEMREKTRP